MSAAETLRPSTPSNESYRPGEPLTPEEQRVLSLTQEAFDKSGSPEAYYDSALTEADYERELTGLKRPAQPEVLPPLENDPEIRHQLDTMRAQYDASRKRYEQEPLAEVQAPVPEKKGRWSMRKVYERFSGFFRKEKDYTPSLLSYQHAIGAAGTYGTMTYRSTGIYRSNYARQSES